MNRAVTVFHHVAEHASKVTTTDDNGVEEYVRDKCGAWLASLEDTNGASKGTVGTNDRRNDANNDDDEAKSSNEKDDEDGAAKEGNEEEAMGGSGEGEERGSDGEDDRNCDKGGSSQRGKRRCVSRSRPEWDRAIMAKRRWTTPSPRRR